MHGANVKIYFIKYQHTKHRSVSQPRNNIAITWSLADTRSCVGTECTKNCALLRYYAASSGNLLQMFRGNLTVPSSGTPEDGTDSSSRNVGNKLPLLAT